MHFSHKPNSIVTTPRSSQLGFSHLVLLGVLTCSLINQVSGVATTRWPPTAGPNRDLQTTRYPQTTTPSRPIIPKPTTLPYYDVYFYPNPQTQPIVCRYPLTHKSYLCDPNMLLTREQGKYIDNVLEQIKTDTKCLCDPKTPCKNGNVKMAVAIVPRVGAPGTARTEKETYQEVRKFAEELRVKYSYGTCDDDILLVVSNLQKMAYLSRGVKLDDRVINGSDVTKLMQEASNITNLSNTVKHIARLLGVEVRDFSNSIQSSRPLSTWTIVSVVALIVGFIVVIALAAAGASYCGRKCNGKEEIQPTGGGGFRNTQAVAATVTETREKGVKAKKKSSNRAWFARIGRRDRHDKGQSARENGYHEYNEPDEEEEDSNEGSYYNHADSQNNNAKDRTSTSSYDRGENGYARSTKDRNSAAYDNRKSDTTYNNSRNSGGSYSDRRSDRNSSYMGSSVATENIF